MRNLYAFILIAFCFFCSLGQALKAADVGNSCEVKISNPGSDSTANKAANGAYKSAKTDFQVFPNPITDKKLNLTFTLSRESQVTVRLIDLLGNEVSVLMDEKKPAGEYRNSFSLDENTRSGLYFIRINVGNEVIAKRISIQ